jgi:2-polyprenyl-6-methoxyphenol hydroxylase-like FAD-dependent oxidoreductase
MRTLPATTDVVIVGAGPSGLALASVLATKSVPFVLLDKLAEGANTSRAAVIHARTLEVLDELAVTSRLHAQGIIVPRFTIRDRDRVLATIRFHDLPTPYPYTLMIPQNVTEAIMLARLRELGGDVHRPCTATDVTQDADSVIVTVTAEGQPAQAIRARYAVGTDGMHSVVRKSAGIGFEGDAYPLSFVLADVRMDWPLRPDEVSLFFSPDGLLVVAPLPGGQHRVVAVMDDAPESPALADVQRLLELRGPVVSAPQVHEVVWGSRFRVHHRVARHYRAGRILLAGDAAHVHSPAGGQGMNTGIQDAVSLGHTLAAILAGEASDGRLDLYERTRRPVAERVVAFTDRMTRVATLRNRRARSLRNGAIRGIGSIPLVQRKLATELAELRYR